MPVQNLNSDTINYIRQILVKTLSSENVAQSDVHKVRLFTKNVNTKHVEKDARLRVVKERQNEERQKKIEEMKAQALLAQRYKDQQEEDRRRRLETIRVKEDSRRQQVEERKRAIHDAERDRVESILRRNQERNARIEAKRRHEKTSSVFAFGSSVPRMLDPTDMTASFWGQRRATSTQNITASPTSSLTRRQSERDLDLGNKKRATSAGGAERSEESSAPTTPAGCASGYVGRRRTDLIPTVPSRDSSFSSSRKSLAHSPGRAYSMSRLDQLAKPRKRPDLPALAESSSYAPRPLSSPRMSSVTRSMIHLAVSKSGPSPTRRNLNKADSRSMHQLSIDGPLLAPRTTRATQLRQQKLNASSNCSEASSRPSSSLSQQSTNSVASSVNVRYRPTTTVRRPRPASIAITGVTHDLKNHHHDRSGETTKPPLPRRRKSISKDKPTVKNIVKSPVDSVTQKLISNNHTSSVNNKHSKDPGEAQPKPPDQQSASTHRKLENNSERVLIPELQEMSISKNVPQKDSNDVVINSNAVEEILHIVDNQSIVDSDNTASITKIQEVVPQTNTSDSITVIDNKDDNNKDVNAMNEMNTSMTKPRITTEEEAKAALAERRRLAREEAERLAEQKRLQVELEAKIERERQIAEEENIRVMIEQQRAAEQERLEEAIRETQKREEEERLRKEEEVRMKILKEEQAKEEAEKAEKQKEELLEKLKNEEKEREARRKRVEAIMSRTRGTINSNAPSQRNSDDKNENKSEMNGTKTGEQENGTSKNGKELEIVDNIITDDDTLKNANNVVSIDTSSDSINSNNSWQPALGNFVCNNNS